MNGTELRSFSHFQFLFAKIAYPDLSRNLQNEQI